MLSDFWERRGDFLLSRGPVVVEEERGSVIDGVELAVPDEQVSVARGAVDVEHKGVEPDEERGFVGRSGVARGGIEHGGAGQKVEAEVEAGAGLEQLADFVVGLVAAKRGVNVDEDQLGHAQAEGASDFAGDDFGDEGEEALAGSAKFDNVETQIVGFDDGGQRAAFAEGNDIARGVDGAQHAKR